ATLYFGTWRLFVSGDTGESWSAPAGDMDLTKGITPKGRDVLTAIGVSASDTSVIYTGSLMGRAMRSSDSGVTWTDITAGLPDRSITGVAVDPADPATAFVTLSGFGSSHVFRTTDAGATWSDRGNGLPDVPANTLMIDPVDPNTIYVGTDIGAFRSTDRGQQWQDFNRGLPPVIVHQFAGQPDGGVIQVATYGRGIYQTTGNERPVIRSATYDGKKRVEISGTGFGDSPSVLINGQDKTGKIVSV